MKAQIKAYIKASLIVLIIVAAFFCCVFLGAALIMSATFGIIWLSNHVTSPISQETFVQASTYFLTIAFFCLISYALFHSIRWLRHAFYDENGKLRSDWRERIK